MISLIGIKKNTPLEIREKFVIKPKRHKEYMQELLKEMKEIVLLATCNRTEIYFNASFNEEELLKKIFESITITNTNYFSFIFSFFIASFIYQISENHALVLTWPCLIYLKSYYLLLNTKKDALNL